jgi:predicted dehydrogenase
MKNGKLQIGIIGCGQIAMSKHMPGLAKLSGKCEMSAFCNPHIEAAQKAAQRFGTPDARVFTDYHELLALPWIDVAYVLTPNVFHAPITVAAFEAGKHVMCEKPMAATTADAQRMMDAWKKSGKKFTVAYQSRFRDEVRSMYEAREDLGEIYFAKAHAIRRRGVPTWGVFTNRELQGGGPLIDIGTHALDLTLWMMDNWEPESVTGQVFCKLGRSLHGADQGTHDHWDPDAYGVEDSAFGFIKMKNGAAVYLEASWLLNTTDEREASTTLYGTKGGAELRNNSVAGSGELVLNFGRYGGQFDVLPKRGAGIVYADARQCDPGDMEAAQWIDAILDDVDPMVRPEQAFVVTQILDAIYRSAETGRTVYFDGRSDKQGVTP